MMVGRPSCHTCIPEVHTDGKRSLVSITTPSKDVSVGQRELTLEFGTDRHSSSYRGLTHEDLSSH